MKRYGCAACHTIPGLAGAQAHVGPTLSGFANRPVFARNVKNTPENVIRWVINPAQVERSATMPSVGVTQKDAKDIATYLYALK